MNKSKINKRMQELEEQLKEAMASNRGLRTAHKRLYDNCQIWKKCHADMWGALSRIERFWLSKLFRWMFRRKAPTRILNEKWENEEK